MAKVILNRPEVVRTAHRLTLPKVNRFLRMSLNISRRTAPVGIPWPGNPAPTGARLRASLHIDGPRVTTSLIRGRMGSKLDYAATVSLGSEAHIIRARRARTLRFYGTRVGRFVYPVQVNHPGRNRPSLYMQRAARVAGFVNGFRVRVRVR